MSTVSSQEFNRNPTSVKRKADQGPVYVTERGQVSYVVINIEEFRRLKGSPATDLVSRLRLDGYDDVELPEVGLGIDGAAL